MATRQYFFLSNSVPSRIQKHLEILLTLFAEYSRFFFKSPLSYTTDLHTESQGIFCCQIKRKKESHRILCQRPYHDLSRNILKSMLQYLQKQKFQNFLDGFVLESRWMSDNFVFNSWYSGPIASSQWKLPRIFLWRKLRIILMIFLWTSFASWTGH